SNGVDQFETPRRVRAIQTHEGEEWIFVEGTRTGLPIRGQGARMAAGLTFYRYKLPPNELGNLIKLLQAQKAVLEDSAAGQDSAPVAIGTTLPEPARLVSIGQNERPKRIS